MRNKSCAGSLGQMECNLRQNGCRVRRVFGIVKVDCWTCWEGVISSPTAALLSTASTAGNQIQIRNSNPIRIQIANFNNLLAVQRASARVLPLFIYAAKYGSWLLSFARRCEREEGVSGAKMKTNTSLSTTTTQFDATDAGVRICKQLRFKPGLLGSDPHGATLSAHR